MVEECKGYGTTGCGGCVFDLLVCWHGVRIAGLGEVYWEVSDLLPARDVYVYQICLSIYFAWRELLSQSNMVFISTFKILQCHSMSLIIKL